MHLSLSVVASSVSAASFALYTSSGPLKCWPKCHHACNICMHIQNIIWNKTMLPFFWLRDVPAYCCFTKLWRFGESDFPACGGASAVKTIRRNKQFYLHKNSDTKYTGNFNYKKWHSITMKYHGRASSFHFAGSRLGSKKEKI
jgi:hypothetical protein